MAVATVKINSTFNSQGVDQANQKFSSLDKNIRQATHNINAGFSNIKTGNIVQGIGQITSGIKNLVLSSPELMLIAGAFVAIAKGISECVKEYAQAEQVQVRFEQSLKSLNLSVFSKYFNDLSSSMQRYTGISDEVIKDAIQIGLQMGISTKDMEKTIKVASDLSATFGIDLRSAVEMLAKAQEGETTQLTRMLPNLKETIKSAKDYSEIIGVIGERVEGAAEAQGNTLIGSMNKLKQSFGDLKETIGSVFTPSLEKLYNWLDKIIQKMNENLKVSVGAEGYEIDKKIKDLELQKKALQVSNMNITPEQTEFVKKQIENIDNQIAMLKQQKVANEKQLKFLEQIEKNTKKEDTSSSSSTTTTLSDTTQKTTSQPETVFVNTGFTSIFNMFQQSEFDFDQFKQTVSETSETVEVVNDRFKGTERNLVTFGEKLRDNIRSFMSNAFGVDLSSWGGFIMSIVQQMQTFQALKNVMQPIIKMLDAIFKPILMALAPILQVIYQILSPILQALAPPLILFAVMIANIIQALKALATTIYYIVTLQWNKLDTVKWAAFTPDQITQMIQQSQADIASAAVENPFADVTNTSTTSYSASGARDIYVNIYFNNSYVNGDAREIALKLRDEIRLAEALGY